MCTWSGFPEEKAFYGNRFIRPTDFWPENIAGEPLCRDGRTLVQWLSR